MHKRRMNASGGFIQVGKTAILWIKNKIVDGIVKYLKDEVVTE